MIATKKNPGHFTLPGLLQVVASAFGPLVSGWLAVSGDGGQPSAWAHAGCKYGWAGFTTSRSRSSQFRQPALRVSEKLFILAYAGPLISILVGPLLSHKQPYVALKYNKEGLD